MANDVIPEKPMSNLSFFFKLITLPCVALWPSKTSKEAEQNDQLAIEASDRFRLHGRLQDLNTAIELQQAAVDATPMWHRESVPRLMNLGVAYSDRYQRLGKIDDLEQSISCAKAAVAALPAGHPDLPLCQQNLAISYLDSFRRSGEMKDLDAAIFYDVAAVNGTPSTHPSYPRRKRSAAITYIDRYERLGEMADLEMASDFAKAALHATSAQGSELAAYQQVVGVTYTHWYRRRGNMEDLASSLKYKEAALANTPPGDPELASRHESVATSFSDRFQRLGDISDLRRASEHHLVAVNNTPTDDPRLAARWENLGVSYVTTYHRLGNLLDLENSILYTTKALNSVKKKTIVLSRIQQTLAAAYRTRYDRLREPLDLEAAFKFGLKAVQDAPPGHPELAAYNRDLAHTYSERYKRYKNLDDLKAALECDKASVDATSLGHPHLLSRLHNMALSYKNVYDRTGRLQMLGIALKCDLAAVEGTQYDHPALPTRLLALANTYRDLHARLNDPDDLETALKYNTRAVEKTSLDDPELSVRCEALAILHNMRYERTREPADLQSALLHAAKSSKSIAADPLRLWSGATYWAEVAWKHELPESLDAYETAFDILPNLIWLGSSLNQRHDILVTKNISSVTTTAVAAALHFGAPQKAVEFLEQGLAITHRQSLELKHHDDLLWIQHPDDAARLQQISVLLSKSAGSETDPSAFYPGQSIDYHILAVERDDLITKIRTYPHFEDFLRPKSFERLRSAAESGPVIMICCTDSGSDALVIIPSSATVRHIPLPGAALLHAKTQLEKLRQALNASHIQARDADADRKGRPADAPRTSEVFSSILGWLWEKVVSPVYSALEEHGYESGRIWWCPSGPFTYLPLHAAAPISSQLIPSYTYTLEALIQARSKEIPYSYDTTDHIMIGVGVTEISSRELPRLPSVRHELDVIGSVVGQQGLKKIVDTEATIASVLENIEHSAWSHFACHGRQDPESPLKSGLELYDGRLELRQILNINLSRAEFIFLSACETAMGDAKLENEAVHLVGAFIAAGFRGAVGTLWSMSDADGPKVAGMVYQEVFRKGSYPDVTKAAEGLHSAVQRLRQTKAPYHQWIPFIHVGI